MKTDSTQTDLFYCKDAVFSGCGKYRYVLYRDFGQGPKCMFIGLNPSTADEHVNDPTIRRCIGFTRKWGYSGLIMVNLFAWRATDPADLIRTEYPVSSHDEPGRNDDTILQHADQASLIVCAWGNHGSYLQRGDQVIKLLKHSRHKMYNFGVTESGQPVHPLYLLKNQTLKPYSLTGN